MKKDIEPIKEENKKSKPKNHPIKKIESVDKKKKINFQKEKSSQKSNKIKHNNAKKTTFEKKSNKTIKKIKIKITKDNVTYFLLGIIDIIIIIYAARKNYAHYVSLAGSKNIYVGSSSRNLIFGKNYITLLTTTFFFAYICLINRFIFHKKNTKKFVITLLLALLFINCILFYAFTNKIY